ncbi:uncharacterized protein LOC106137355 [Amyelois transitella]|nr:uncharacterized protein LOC106137355 [Amyelois transitella]
MTRSKRKFAITDKFLPRLAKNLTTRKGSRRANTGNRLEHAVLTHIQHVP